MSRTFPSLLLVATTALAGCTTQAAYVRPTVEAPTAWFNAPASAVATRSTSALMCPVDREAQPVAVMLKRALGVLHKEHGPAAEIAHRRAPM
jgi:hypothetical protein